MAGRCTGLLSKGVALLSVVPQSEGLARHRPAKALYGKEEQRLGTDWHCNAKAWRGRAWFRKGKAQPCVALHSNGAATLGVARQRIAKATKGEDWRRNAKALRGAALFCKGVARRRRARLSKGEAEQGNAKA